MTRKSIKIGIETLILFVLVVFGVVFGFLAGAFAIDSRIYSWLNMIGLGA